VFSKQILPFSVYKRKILLQILPFYMNKLFALLFVLVLASVSQAQSTIRYTKIIDGGAILSTPRLCENENDLKDLIAVTDPDFARKLCPRAEESAWPSAIETLDKRNSGGRELLKQCNIYYVADIGNDAVLLWVPVKINQHMPADMLDKGDFLVMIGKNAVVLGDKVSLYGETKQGATTETNTKPLIDFNARGFQNQFANIVADYQNQFRTIKGDEIPEEKGSISFTKDYKSKIVLSGSKNTYVAVQKIGSEVSLIADYGDFDDKSTAIARHKEIVGLIDNTTFPCCTFVKADEQVQESVISQGYLPFDLADKMAPEFDKIVIEVNVIKTFRLSEDYKLIDQWGVVLMVRSLD
jgi:hypothetical protein